MAANGGATVCFCVLQVSECHPDNVPTHPAVPYDGRHRQQRRAEAQTSAQGLGESHSTGKIKTSQRTIYFILNHMAQGFRAQMSCAFIPRLAGVVHIQGPNHGVCGVSLRQLRL